MTHNRPIRRILMALGAIALIWLPAALAQTPKTADQKPPTPSKTKQSQPPIAPTIPSQNRHQPNKVFLEHSDFLLQEESTPDYQILRGNVQFRKGDMFMYCDSAYFYESTNSIDAFGNIRMEQGDTLFVYGDELNYNGLTDLARLYSLGGRKARLINKDVQLTSVQFDYDLANKVGYYMLGGVLTDKKNRLTSREGYYHPDTKEAFFYDKVVLTGPRDNDTLHMYTDSLEYNTETQIATLLASTLIVNKDGEIRSSDGIYDTKSDEADLYSRSMVVTRRGNTLTGDTLFYDRKSGIGEAFGNMVLTDSARKSTLYGEYGFYNENSDSVFVTGEALALEYSRKDTLYMHGDTIISIRLPEDSTTLTKVFHAVKFFRKDMQGLSDSMLYYERDSTLYLYRHPIVWTGTRQIHGNQIDIHMNDSTIDVVHLPKFGMMTDHVAEDCYDQLSGSDMTVWINDTVVSRLYVEGNVRILMFPMESDSSYNKFTFVESSYMNAKFKDNQPDTIQIWPETTGYVTPLFIAKPSQMYLPDFQWYEALRPLAPDEVFDRPKELRMLMEMPEVGGKRRK
ncbi:MAG: hypothetical protein HUK14_01020 [Muribaculaceae bacterium]|nr:hypothetical protein [Muribaculaceae bacterium]